MTEDSYGIYEQMKARARRRVHAEMKRAMDEVLEEECVYIRYHAEKLGIASKGFIRDLINVRNQTLLEFMQGWIDSSQKGDEIY